MGGKNTNLSWYQRLLKNSRFWILAVAVTLSISIAGFIQLMVPAGSLQTIRIEQIYGFLSLALLYIALLASPLTKVFPKLPGKMHYLHARRGIGVSALYFAVLHFYISFFQQLGGFNGVKYLNHKYSLSLFNGVIALAILIIMGSTSFDWIVDHLGYKAWKLVHRTVYIASVAILLHIILIGPHYDKGLTFLGALTYIAIALLLVLEVLRMRLYVLKRKGGHD